MAKQVINIGTSANDGTGDPARTAFTKTNDNFTELYTEDARTDNPHGVTKSQVGLSNVDNTADADKPVSTAQGTAIATAKSEAIAASIPTSEKGAALGVATLGADGTLPLSQGAKVGTVTPNNSPIVLGDDLQAIADKAQGQDNASKGIRLLTASTVNAVINTYYEVLANTTFNDIATPMAGDYYKIKCMGGIVTIAATGNFYSIEGTVIERYYNGTSWSTNIYDETITRGYLSPKLTRWYRKFYNSPSTAKIAFVGDSTSELTSNAQYILASLTVGNSSPYVNIGDPMYGFDSSVNLPNFGSSGMPLATWVGDPTIPKGLNDLIAYNPDLVVFGYGINDVRVNTVTTAQLKALLIRAIESIRAALPNADIVLRMANSFLIPSTDFYIKLTGASAPTGGYATLADAAQAQTDQLYNAYKELDNYWDNVYMLNVQDLIYGRTCMTSSILMTDEIHPTYVPMMEKLIPIICPPSLKPYSKNLAQNAMSANPTTPWVIYNRVLEDATNFTLKASGRVNIASSNNVSITCENAYDFNSAVQNGCILNFGNNWFIDTSIYANNIDVTVDSSTICRIFFVTLPATLPAELSTLVTCAVNVYMPKYNLDVNAKQYIDNRRGYPYVRKVYITSAGNGYIDIANVPNVYSKSGAIGEYGESNVGAGYFNLLPTNIMLIRGGSPLTLTSAGFSIQTSTSLRILKSGDYTSYSRKIAYIVGTQPYEDFNSIKKNISVLWPNNTVAPVLGTMGVKNGGLKVNTSEGEAAYGGLIYLDTSEPAGNTITNTTTKTYFESKASFASQIITANEYLRTECVFALSTAAVAGNAIVTVELGSGTILLTSASFALPISENTIMAKLDVDIFLKSIAAGLATIGGSAVFDIVGVMRVPLFRTSDITNMNNVLVNDLRVSIKFDTADVANIILMKTMKVLSFKQ